MVLSPSLPEAATDDRLAAVDGLQALCAWAVAQAKQPLPENVRRRAALVLADDISAMVAASSEPQVEKAQPFCWRPAVPRKRRCSQLSVEPAHGSRLPRPTASP